MCLRRSVLLRELIKSLEKLVRKKPSEGATPWNLPPFPEISGDLLHAIAERHGVAGAAISRLPEVGIFNAIYALGTDLILRIPRDHPAFTDAA